MADASDEARVAASTLRLAPGLERVRLPGGDLGLVSDQVSLRLEGKSVGDFEERLLARLDGSCPVGELLSDWAPAARARALALLDQFLDAGVVIEVDDAAPPGPVESMLKTLGVGVEGRRRLSEAVVGVVGLEGPGAHAVMHLATMGVGTLVLIDPFPLGAGDRELWPPLPRSTSPIKRQDAVAGLVEQSTGATALRPLEESVAHGELRDCLGECDAVVHCFDRGFSASAAWVNEWALASGRIAAFGRLEGHVGWAGPMVFPGEGPCWLCGRMRAIACADDFELAMGLEEELDQQKRPRLARRPGFPHVSAQLGAVLAMELIKVLLAIGAPKLVGRVMAIDGLQATTEEHPVLQRPDCPACRKKALPPHRRRDARRAVVAEEEPGLSGTLADSVDRLVSPATGIVRSLTVVPKDPFEPVVPVVVRAELANHRFAPKGDDPFEVCSGKGMSVVAARVSALGEACERYSGARCDPDRLVAARRDQLPGRSLDPADLVLYAPHQYATLPYHPWQDNTTLDWIHATDEVTGEQVHVPAIAALMHYQVHHPSAFLFPITSNGLAAGPSRDAAVLAAALEVIERDAFVISWLQRLPARRLDPRTVPDGTVRDLTELYSRRGVSLELYLLPTDLPVPVVLAMGVDGTGAGPAAVVGLGCDVDPVTACRGAVLEVGQVRPALKARLRDPEVRSRQAELVADPSQVSALEDHDVLFADATMLDHLDFWRGADPEPFDLEASSTGDASEQLAHIVTELDKQDAALLAVDLTSPELAQLGVHTARAIVPGLQPIHFGAGEARLGGVRLYALPGQLGLFPTATDPADIDDLPHPLS